MIFVLDKQFISVQPFSCLKKIKSLMSFNELTNPSTGVRQTSIGRTHSYVNEERLSKEDKLSEPTIISKFRIFINKGQLNGTLYYQVDHLC